VYYKLIYQTRISSEKQSYSFKDKEEMLAFINQLHRGIAFLEWNPMNGIEDFSYFELRQKNYIQTTSNKEEYMVSMWEDGHPVFKWWPFEWPFTPIDEDITNLILNDCKATSKKKNIRFEWEYLWIYNESFQFKWDTNIRFLTELIFKTQERLNTNTFGYSEVLESWSILEIRHTLPKVLDYDFCWNTVKKRFPKIKKELDLEEDFIKFSTQGIEINI